MTKRNLYTHVKHEDGHSVAYVEVGLRLGLDVSSCITVSEEMRKVDREICFTKLSHDVHSEPSYFSANAKNNFSLLSLNAHRGNMLKISVYGIDAVAMECAEKLYSAIRHGGNTLRF